MAGAHRRRRPGPQEPYGRERGDEIRENGDRRYRDRQPRFGSWPEPQGPYRDGEVPRGRHSTRAAGRNGKSPPTRAERYDLYEDSRVTSGRLHDGGDERYRGRGPEPGRDEAFYYREGYGWQVGDLSSGAPELDAGLYERQMAGITALLSLANEVAGATKTRETTAPSADERRKQSRLSVISRLRQDEMTWNSLFLVLSTGLQSGTGFLFWIIAAHLFSASDVGKGSALINGISLIGSLSLLGLNIGMGRYLPTARNRDSLISSGLATVAAVGAVGALIYILLTPYIAPELSFVEKSPVLTVSFALLTAAMAVNTLTDNVFIASRRAKYTTFVDGVIGGFGKLILAALLTGLGAYGVFLASAIGTVLAAVASLILILLVMRVRVDLKRPFETLRPLIRFAGANYIGNVINLFAALAIPLIVLDRLGAASSAYFFIVFQMAQIVYAAALALEQTFLAEGSRADADMRALRRRSLRLLIIFCVVAGGIMIGAGRWLLLAFGHAYYEHGYITLIAMTLAAAPISATYWFQTILRLHGKLRAIIVVNLLGGIATCVAVWFGASHGLSSVAWGWLVGETVAALAAGLATREKSPTPAKEVVFNTFKHFEKSQRRGCLLVSVG